MNSIEKRLIELRDEMRRTPEGREALTEICRQLTALSSDWSRGIFWAQRMEAERMRAQRDAAAADLKRAAQLFNFCDFCDNVRVHKDTDMEYRCKTCRNHSNYAWRGERRASV